MICKRYFKILQTILFYLGQNCILSLRLKKPTLSANIQSFILYSWIIWIKKQIYYFALLILLNIVDLHRRELGKVITCLVYCFTIWIVNR
jgi:hypothetical protein